LDEVHFFLLGGLLTEQLSVAVCEVRLEAGECKIGAAILGGVLERLKAALGAADGGFRLARCSPQVLVPLVGIVLFLLTKT
jgi:hypothetical protein